MRGPFHECISLEAESRYKKFLKIVEFKMNKLVSGL